MVDAIGKDRVKGCVDHIIASNYYCWCFMYLDGTNVMTINAFDALEHIPRFNLCDDPTHVCILAFTHIQYHIQKSCTPNLAAKLAAVISKWILTSSDRQPKSGFRTQGFSLFLPLASQDH
jgi:hypothetical protein